MKMRKHILDVLALPEIQRLAPIASFDLRTLLCARGVWFVDARLWPALRSLESEGLIARFTDYPATREGRPRYSFRLTLTAGLRTVIRGPFAPDGLDQEPANDVNGNRIVR